MAIVGLSKLICGRGGERQFVNAQFQQNGDGGGLKQQGEESRQWCIQSCGELKPSGGLANLLDFPDLSVPSSLVGLQCSEVLFCSPSFLFFHFPHKKFTKTVLAPCRSKV